MIGLHKKILRVLCSCRYQSGEFYGITKQQLRDKMDDGLGTKVILRELTDALNEMVLSGWAVFDVLDLDGLEETSFSATERGYEELSAPTIAAPSVGVTKSEHRMDELYQRLYEIRSKK